jgi:hypothetical protein
VTEQTYPYWGARRTARFEQARSTGKCGQICGGTITQRRSQRRFDGTGNHLISKKYLLMILFDNCLLQTGRANHYMLPGDAWLYQKLLIPLSESADRTRLRNRGRRSMCHLNLTHCGDTKASMWRDVSGI